MTGTVVQVSISPGGVPKRPIVEGRVTKRGIEGDGWRHPAIHGGPKRAILLSTAEGVDDLAAQGFPVYYGALGENITTRGIDRRALRIGQRLRAGGVVIELTQIRIPCHTLNIYGRAIQMAMYDARAQAGDATSPVWGLSGFYAVVLQTGVLRPGDLIQCLV